VKRYFWRVLRSPKVSWREKLEFLTYYSLYYLQSTFLCVGLSLWLLSECMHAYLPFWQAALGWGLFFTNLLALPLLTLTGLFLEQSARRDFEGVFSMFLLTLIVAPFQAYASLKGLLQREERSPWIRTLKTGKITELSLRVKLRKLLKTIIPKKQRRSRIEKNGEEDAIPKRKEKERSTIVLIVLTIMNSALFILSIIIPVKAQEDITKLYFEWKDNAITVNNHTTNRIFTHQDYFDPGPTHHRDRLKSPGRSFFLSVDGDASPNTWYAYPYDGIGEHYLNVRSFDYDTSYIEGANGNIERYTLSDVDLEGGVVRIIYVNIEAKRLNSQTTSVLVKLLYANGTLIDYQNVTITTDQYERYTVRFPNKNPFTLSQEDINGLMVEFVATSSNLCRITFVYCYIKADYWGETDSDFYLYGPLEQDYHLNGSLQYHLYLYPIVSDPLHYDFRFMIYDVYSNGTCKYVHNDTIKNVVIHGWIKEYILVGTSFQYTFEAGNTIRISIHVRAGPRVLYFYYDHNFWPSQVDFPGELVPENLVFLAPFALGIPKVIYKLNERAIGGCRWPWQRRERRRACSKTPCTDAS
jgi:hypothetical protein